MSRRRHIGMRETEMSYYSLYRDLVANVSFKGNHRHMTHILWLHSLPVGDGDTNSRPHLSALSSVTQWNQTLPCMKRMQKRYVLLSWLYHDTAQLQEERLCFDGSALDLPRSSCSQSHSNLEISPFSRQFEGNDCGIRIITYIT